MSEKYRLRPCMYYPRLYLDTNVLIDAILEIDPKKAERRNASRAILNNWEQNGARGGGMSVSPYVIGEFIAKGRTAPHNKSFSDMIKLVETYILPRCQILYTSFSLEEISSLNPEGDRAWILAKKNIRGMGIIRETKEKLGILDFETIWGMDMSEVISYGGGLPYGKMPPVDHVVPETVEEGSIQAPAFEILLFNIASELAIKYKMHLSDAIHLLYANTREIDIIVSNDNKLRKSWESIDPSLKPRLEIVSSIDIIKRFYEPI